METLLTSIEEKALKQNSRSSGAWVPWEGTQLHLGGEWLEKEEAGLDRGWQGNQAHSYPLRPRGWNRQSRWREQFLGAEETTIRSPSNSSGVFGGGQGHGGRVLML